MPAAAKEALTQNGGSRPRPANGKGGASKDKDSSSKPTDAWSEEQELALVQVWIFAARSLGIIQDY